MKKRLTIEFVRSEFEKEGYELLSNTYTNSLKKYKYRCPEGHEGAITWGNFQQGRRCRKCVDALMGVKRRHSLSFLKKEFEKEGYQLLSKEYIGAHSKLKLKCPEGHELAMAWANFSQGQRCRKCMNILSSIKRTLSISYVKKEIEKEGYKLLSNAYISAASKLKVVCLNNHETEMSWNNFQQGKRCGKCSGPRSINLEYIRKEFEKEGYQLLSKEYNSAKTKLKCRCPEGHDNEISWDCFSHNKRGRRCRTCYLLSICGEGHPMWKGGISAEPYCFEWKNKEYRELIKERDGHRCLNPTCYNGTKLVGHHIDYNKKNCSLDNVITICLACNSAANVNRDWWTKWYQTILKHRYGYSYKNKE